MKLRFINLVVATLLWCPTFANANPEVRGWAKLLGAGLQFPELPPSIDSSSTGSLSTANLRLEMSGEPTPGLRLDLALVGQAQWIDFPDLYESLGDSVPGAGGGGRTPGRLLDVKIEEKVRDFSFAGDVDRLAAAFWLGDLEIIMGRQAISWARTMVFQPLDVLGPFSLLSFDTEAKPGIDALRVRVPIFSEGTLDLVANQGTKLEKSAYAGRMTIILGDAELGFMGGRVRDQWMVALDGVWSLKQWSLRWESLYLPDRGGLEGLVAAVGFERFFLNGDLQLFLELLHDSRGASGAQELVDVFSSAAFVEGRMKVPCKNAGALGVRYQLAALWSMNLSVVADLRHPTGLGFLQLTRSLSDNVSMDVLAYKAVGESWALDPALGIRPASSFGSFPSMVALYLRVYQ